MNLFHKNTLPGIGAKFFETILPHKEKGYKFTKSIFDLTAD